MRLIAFALAVAMLPAAALAQDGAWGNLAGDLALSNLRHQQMEDMLGIDTWSAKGQRQLRQGKTDRPSPNGSRPAGAPAGRPTSSSAFPFRSTAASRQAAKQAYVSRIERSNPASARVARAELAKHDYFRIYAGLIAPFGLRAGDAVDAIAAYTMLGYIIATGSRDPSPAQVRAVRGQIAARAAANPAMADPTKRAGMAEELQLLFVTLHAGWQSARKDGSLPGYGDGVARLFKNNGVDLRALRLTDRGFAAT
jgi:hypothetical protein